MFTRKLNGKGMEYKNRCKFMYTINNNEEGRTSSALADY